MRWSALHALLAGAPGTWSACVCALDGNQCWGYNERVIQPAASLIKVPLAMTVIDAMADRLHETVPVREADRVEGVGPLDRSEAEPHKRAPQQATLGDLLAHALIYSDNTAANLLIDRVGMDGLNGWLEAHHLQTRMRRKFMDYAARGAGRDNTTSAADMCMILHEIVQPRYAALLALLRRAVADGKLEVGVPRGTPLARKGGDLPDVEHDAGIVYAPQGAYIVAVLGAKLPDTAAARATIAQASRLVWNAMTERVGA